MTTQPAEVTHDLFISYAETDRAWVDGFLLDALEAAGANYHSEDAFALGVPRLIEFERAIKQSKRTLLILSQAYLTDTFGQFVDVLVNSYGMETATWPVIPLLLEPIVLPPRLSQLVRLDATTAEGEHKALARLCAELQRPVPGPPPLPACPYPGMVPFDEADSNRFFGREQEVQDLADRLRLHPFLAVIGASGSGKSSLVRAGLIPALRKSRLFGAGEWLVRTMRPGTTPLETLAHSVEDLSRTKEVGATAAPIAASLPDLALPAGARLLLVVDQFEETFTVAGAEALPFQQTLQQLAAAPNCYVVLTVRADFYADLMTSPLWSQVQAHRAEVAPMSEAGLRRAIVRPAEQSGVAIEAALVERLIADASGEPGVLPLIQETLVLLWERLERRFLPMRAYEALVLTRDAYGGQNGEERTGLQVAIARRADATMASLTEEQQVIARRIFLRLIQFGEGRADTRRQQPLAALRSVGDDGALFDATLQRLAESRLLTLSGEAIKSLEFGGNRRATNGAATADSRSSVVVDISHEALIRGWPALQGWLNERREAEQMRRRLEGKVAEWVRLGSGEGGLLDQVEVLEAERWLESTDAEEMGFDAALPELVVWSRAVLEEEEQEKEAARQRELQQAQALAEEQRQRAEEQAAASKRLRQRAVFLAGALATAVLAAIAAVLFLGQSQRSAAEALSQKNIAVAEGQRADQQRVTAVAEGQRADQQRATAVANFTEAQRQKTLAEQNERQAHISELAAQSELAGARFPQQNLLLAIEALNISRQSNQPAAASAIDALRSGLIEIGGRPLAGAEEPPSAVAFSPGADGRYLAIGSAYGPVRVWDLRAGLSAKPTILRGHEGQVVALAFSPDGRYLATGSFDGTARRWDLTDPSADPLVLPQGNQVNALAFSPDGRYLVTSSNDGAARRWDLTDPSADPLVLDGEGGPITALAFSPDGHYVVTGSQAKLLRWDLTAADPSSDPLLLYESKDEYDPATITTVAFSPDGRRLAAGGGHNVFTVWLWDLKADGQAGEPTALTGHTAAIISLLFRHDGQTLISSGRDNEVRLWDLAQEDPGAAPRILRGHEDEIRAAVLSPDEHYLATGGLDHTVRLWDLSQADPNVGVAVLKGHDDAIFALSFSPDGSSLVTASYDHTARVWDLSAASHVNGATVLGDGTALINGLAFSPDGRTLAGGSADSIARLWDVHANNPAGSVVRLSGHENMVNAVAFSPDGRTLATSSDDNVVQLWTPGAPDFDKHPTRRLDGPVGGTLALAFSPDGRYLAGGNQDKTVWLWDQTAAASSANPAMLPEQTDAIYSVAFSPDSATLATATRDGIIQLWDVKSRQPRGKPLLGHADAVVSLAFSPDGRYLASASWDKTARLWNVRAADPAASSISLSGHKDVVNAVAFSPDGQYLATASNDKTVRLWDMKAVNPAASFTVLSGHKASVTAAAFSPDGRYLATGDADATVLLWQLELPALIDQACQAAGRNLTWEEWQTFLKAAPYRATCPSLPPHPSFIDHLLDDAAAQAHQGKIAEAAAAYADAQQRSPQYAIVAWRWDDLCRAGALWGHVNDVLAACGRAVALAPNDGAYRDSRGLARALIGDPSGAIDDFTLYMAWAEQQDAEGNKGAITRREAWIADLKAGRNPFDEATLKGLRESMQ